MSTGIFPTGVEVVTAVCREDASLSYVKIVADFPGAPEGFGLALDRETALLVARDIQASCALIERGEHGRDDA